MVLGSREGEDHRADEREAERTQVRLPAIDLVLEQQSQTGSQRGDLRQRQIDENDFPPHNVQAEIDENARQQQARDQRPFHHQDNVGHGILSRRWTDWLGRNIYLASPARARARELTIWSSSSR